MLKQHDQLLVERSGLVGWLGLQGGPPQGYRTRQGGMLMFLESASAMGWDDDDVTADEEEEDDEEDDDDDDLLDDEDDDDDDDEEEEVDEEE